MSFQLIALLFEHSLAAELDFIAFEREDLDQNLVAFLELVANVFDPVFGDLADVQQTYGKMRRDGLLVGDGYLHDIFLSYKRDPRSIHWTREFVNTLGYLVTEAGLGRRTEIFVDESGIALGETWSTALGNALRQSRCMVALWSPGYFGSPWCMSEWRSFRARERILGVRGLIVPAVIHDGDYFPTDARETQWVDISRFHSIFPAFWGSASALELEKFLKDELVPRLLPRVQNPPAFDPTWPAGDEAPAAPIAIPLRRL